MKLKKYDSQKDEKSEEKIDVSPSTKQADSVVKIKFKKIKKKLRKK